MKECPNCKVIRENNNRYCECGYDLRLNRPDGNKASRKNLKFLIVSINILFSAAGVWLTPYITIGFTGFMFDKATIISKSIASLLIVIFLVALVISNYFIIRKAFRNNRSNLVLTGLAAFLIGFALFFYIYFSIILEIF